MAEARCEALGGREEGVYEGWCGRQFLEVHHGGGEVDLGRDVVQSSAYGACEAVLGFGPAVDAFDVPAVADVFFAGLRIPSFFFSPPGPEQCGEAIDDNYCADLGAWRYAAFA